MSLYHEFLSRVLYHEFCITSCIMSFVSRVLLLQSSSMFSLACNDEEMAEEGKETVSDVVTDNSMCAITSYMGDVGAKKERLQSCIAAVVIVAVKFDIVVRIVVPNMSFQASLAFVPNILSMRNLKASERAGSGAAAFEFYSCGVNTNSYVLFYRSSYRASNRLEPNHKP